MKDKVNKTKKSLKPELYQIVFVAYLSIPFCYPTDESFIHISVEDDENSAGEQINLQKELSLVESHDQPPFLF